MEAVLNRLPVEVDEIIAGKYRVVKLIAAGGQGAVLKAHHQVLDRPVAIKVMLPSASASHDGAQRFLREARAAARISSDYVARVTDVDLIEDSVPFMVMEFLEGRDLSELLHSEGCLPVTMAVDIALEALAGLDAAHRLGVVHRDLKPSNLFLVDLPDGGQRIKMLDFGISKVMDDGASGLKAGATTSSEAIMGTPRYMSPEQVSSSKDVDGRTDIWSIGVVLYEMLAEHYPFEGDTAGAILANILTMNVPPLRQHLPEIPLALDRVVMRCMERERDKRYPDVRLLMRDLGPFASPRVRAQVLRPEELQAASAVTEAHGTPSEALSLPSSTTATTLRDEISEAVTRTGPESGPPTQTSMTVDDSFARRRAKRWKVVAAAAAALGIGGLAWVAASAGDDKIEPTAAASSTPSSSAALDVAANIDATPSATASAAAPVPATASASGASAGATATPSAAPSAKPSAAPAKAKLPPRPSWKPPAQPAAPPPTPAPAPVDPRLGDRN